MSAVNKKEGEDLKEFILDYLDELIHGVAEFRGHIQEMRRGNDFSALYEPLFRNLHSIKANAMFLGMEEVSHEVHQLEELMIKIKEQGLSTQDKKHIDAFEDAVAIIEDAIDNFDALVDHKIQKQVEEPQGDDLGLGRPLEVLIVDDEEHLHFILEDFVKDYFKANCSFASNGREGLEQLAKKKFDIVITDFFMPEVNGEELIRGMRLTESINQVTPAILITGYKPQFTTETKVWQDVYLLEKPYKESQLRFIFRCAVKVN